VLNQQYAELAELAGGFIHEIKNHLSTLGLNLQLLAEDFHEPQSQRERRALERIQRLQGECHHLIDVSNDFLRFARVSDLELSPTDLRAVVEELVDFFAPMARADHIDIKCYFPADLPPVALDRDLFKQALLNLLLNAQQAMPGGGELTIQASVIPASPEPSSEVRGQRSEVRQGGDGALLTSDLCPLTSGFVELSLIDTGKGMPPEVLTKAFRPFYSTRSGGTGLGLATTRKIVEAHGGAIDAQSEVGRGTKFTIRLPMAAPTAPAPPQQVSAPPG
jgi:signal transduction histidine kinase